MSGSLITVRQVLRTNEAVALLRSTALNVCGLVKILLIFIVAVTVKLCRMLS